MYWETWNIHEETPLIKRQLLSLAITEPQYSKTTRRRMLLTGDHMHFHGQMVLAMLAEMKELLKPYLFNVEEIAQTLNAVYMGGANVPPTLRCLLREANLVNIILSRVMDFYNQISIVFSQFGSEKSLGDKILLNRLHEIEYKFETGEFDFLSLTSGGSSSIILSGVSQHILEQYGDLTKGDVPGEFCFLNPYSWVDEDGKKHELRTATLYMWTNYMLGKLEQMHRIFSFIPRKSRVIGLSTRSTGSVMIEKAGRMLRQPLSVIMQFLTRPATFLIGINMELTFMLNESLRVALNNIRDDNVEYNIRDNSSHDNLSVVCFRGLIPRRIQSPFALTVLETLNSSTILSSGSLFNVSETSGSVVIPSTPTSPSGHSYYSTTDLLQRNARRLVSQTDIILLLLPTQYFSVGEIPLAQASSSYTRILSTFIGGIWFFSPSGASINHRTQRFKASRRTPSLSPLSFLSNRSFNTTLRMQSQLNGGNIQGSSSNLLSKSVSGNALLYSVVQQLLCVSSPMLEAASSSGSVGGVDEPKGGAVGEASTIQSGLQFVTTNEMNYLRSMVLPQKMDFLNAGLSLINFSVYYFPCCRLIPLIRLKDHSLISLGGEVVDETFLRNNGLVLIPVSIQKMHPRLNSVFVLFPRDRSGGFGSSGSSSTLSVSSAVVRSAVVTGTGGYAADTTFVASTSCFRNTINLMSGI
jgi:hypothetical protein